MAESSERRDQPRKLLAGGVIKIKIALASALVLTVGAWLAPRAAPTEFIVLAHGGSSAIAVGAHGTTALVLMLVGTALARAA